MRKTRTDSGWRSHGYFMETILQSLTAAAIFKRRAAFELEALFIRQRQAFWHSSRTSDAYENTNCFWERNNIGTPSPPHHHHGLIFFLLLSDILESIRRRWIISAWSLVRGNNCFDTCRVINNKACCDRVNKVRQTNQKKSEQTVYEDENEKIKTLLL